MASPRTWFVGEKFGLNGLAESGSFTPVNRLMQEL